MRQDHPDGHRIRLPGDHIDAVAVNGRGNPLPHGEFAENQAVELALVLQGIDDDALLRKGFQPFRRLIGDQDLRENHPHQPVKGKILLPIKTPRMVDADFSCPKGTPCGKVSP